MPKSPRGAAVQGRETSGISWLPRLIGSGALPAFTPGGDHGNEDGNGNDAKYEDESAAVRNVPLKPARRIIMGIDKHYDANKDKHERDPGFEVAEQPNRATEDN